MDDDHVREGDGVEDDPVRQRERDIRTWKMIFERAR